MGVMTPQHRKFLARLDASSAAVYAVASHLSAQGWTVEVSGLARAPIAADHESYVDDGDLYLIETDGAGNRSRHRIEVKGLGIRFTGPSDFPFREIFISSKSTVERIADHVRWWISVSSDLSHIAIVSKKSRPDWYLVEKRVSNTNNIEANYAAPLSAVFWRAL